MLLRAKLKCSSISMLALQPRANLLAAQLSKLFIGSAQIVLVYWLTFSACMIANAGCVIAGVVELRRGTLAEAFQIIKRKIRENVETVVELAYKGKAYPREAGESLARERVITAMKDTGQNIT